jgi:hypothetical protein
MAWIFPDAGEQFGLYASVIQGLARLNQFGFLDAMGG